MTGIDTQELVDAGVEPNLAAVVEIMTEQIGHFVREEIRLLKGELDERLDKLAAAAGGIRSLTPTWRGTWEPGVSYGVNALVNDRNALWIAEVPTAARPGTADSGWKLAIKSPPR
jgi:hypothetical protein